MSTQNNPLEVENLASGVGRRRLKGLSGDELFDTLHPKPDAKKETARDLLNDLRNRDKTASHDGRDDE